MLNRPAFNRLRTLLEKHRGWVAPGNRLFSFQVFTDCLLIICRRPLQQTVLGALRWFACACP
jgi:hypothetical protein